MNGYYSKHLKWLVLGVVLTTWKNGLKNNFLRPLTNSLLCEDSRYVSSVLLLTHRRRRKSRTRWGVIFKVGLFSLVPSYKGCSILGCPWKTSCCCVRCTTLAQTNIHIAHVSTSWFYQKIYCFKGISYSIFIIPLINKTRLRMYKIEPVTYISLESVGLP